MNPYALAWTITAGVGALLSSALIWESFLDLRSLGSIRNGRRWRVWGRIIQECLRLAVHIPFFVIGLAALNTPVNPESTGTIIVLLWGNVAFIINSLVAFVVRHKADQSNTEATAEELAARAQAATELIEAAADTAAARVKATAVTAAEGLVDVAATASDAVDAIGRGADAAERTADNTERIASNTDPAS